MTRLTGEGGGGGGTGRGGTGSGGTGSGGGGTGSGGGGTAPVATDACNSAHLFWPEEVLPSSPPPGVVLRVESCLKRLKLEPTGTKGFSQPEEPCGGFFGFGDAIALFALPRPTQQVQHKVTRQAPPRLSFVGRRISEICVLASRNFSALVG